MIKKPGLTIAALSIIAMLLCGCSVNKSAVTATPAPTQTLLPTSTPEPTLTKGTWEGDAFTSNFARLRFTLPKGWKALSDEELAKIMGVAEELLKDNKWIIEATKLKTIQDMIAQDPISGNNVLIQYENLSLTPSAESVSETEYMEILKKQMESLKEFNYSFGEPFSASIAGRDFTGLQANESKLGYRQYFYLLKQSGYMVTIIVTLSDNTKIEDILPYFSPV